MKYAQGESNIIVSDFFVCRARVRKRNALAGGDDVDGVIGLFAEM
jgi:hypothetical protein